MNFDQGANEELWPYQDALSWAGVRELVYSGTDIARYLGVTTSCINRIITTGFKVDIDDIISDL